MILIKWQKSIKEVNFLNGDYSDELGKKSFSKSIKYNCQTERFRLDHNLYTMFEGESLGYDNTNDEQKLNPFKKFAIDNEGDESILFLLSEKSQGDIIIDCGFPNLFKNMYQGDSAYRFF